jgi:PII-like signaling protein
MRLAGEAKLLRIFVGERDKVAHKPLYEVIVHRAKQAGLAGATVLRAVEGFGAGSVIHKAKLLELSEDLPFVIEIVDAEQKIKDFLKTIDDLFDQANAGGLVTLEKVEIIKYTPPRKKS